MKISSWAVFIHYAKREMLLFFFGKFRECFDLASRADRIVDYAMGTMYVAEHYFYWGLSAARLCLEGAADRRSLLRTLRRALRKYEKWTKSCPENFSHKHCLLKAELARVKGNKAAAADGYHQALVLARQNNYIHAEGLAGEAAADFYFSAGYDEIGRAYITEARNAFHRWGADAKVKRLEQLYPHVGSIVQVRSRASETSSTITGSVIDLSTLQKALETIAEEKVHTRMLEKIIRTSVEFAGAQKGILILRKRKFTTIKPAIRRKTYAPDCLLRRSGRSMKKRWTSSNPRRSAAKAIFPRRP